MDSRSHNRHLRRNSHGLMPLLNSRTFGQQMPFAPLSNEQSKLRLNSKHSQTSMAMPHQTPLTINLMATNQCKLSFAECTMCIIRLMLCH
jgi:hypothetical protein